MSLTNDYTHQPASIVAIGAGNRMRTYMHYVSEHPDEVKLVAVVEPDAWRRNSMAEQFGVPEEHRFDHYNHFFQHPVPADAVIICTPESEHFHPCMAALQHGYHVLLEKPIAQTLDECLQIADAAKKAQRVVSICHVLRYHPCFLKIKELIDGGTLGKIISINHTEGVGINRMTHSYVRGTMNHVKDSNPLLLAKCCHDADFLVWITGSRCRRVSSFGSLRWFRPENAPQEASKRCIDCKLEPTCPYSAIELYWRRREWISNFNVPTGQTIEDVIQHELHEGPFGRCVYHCDNDVADNQIMSMEMEDGTVINLSIDVFTMNDYRTIHIRMTDGEIFCDERKVRVDYFRSREHVEFDFRDALNQPFHAGADLKIIEEFIRFINGGSPTLRSLIEESLESHRICFEGERSRLTGQTIEIRP